MKLSIVCFSALILYVSASLVPSIRGGPDAQTQQAWMTASMSFSQTTMVAKQQLMQLATQQMITVSLTAVATTTIISFNIDCVQLFATELNALMIMTMPAVQMINVQTNVDTMYISMEKTCDAVMKINPKKGKDLKKKLEDLKKKMKAVLKQMNDASMAGGMTDTIMTVISSTTLQQLTQVCSDLAKFQSISAMVYVSTCQQTQAAGFLFMDLVQAVGQAAKSVVAVMINTVISGISSASTATVQASTSVQTMAMQQTSTAMGMLMTGQCTIVQAEYATLIVSLSLQTEFDVSVVTTQAAQCEQSSTSISMQITQNMSDANSNFTKMCSDMSDAQAIATVAVSITEQITVIMQTQTSMSTTQCATLAIMEILMEQSNGHKGIGQCVSDGKKENDKDMQSIQQNFTNATNTNMQNITNCCNKYKNTTFTGKSAPNTDTGADKTAMMQSCMKRHSDPDMKKMKDDSDKKCKKYHEGGEQHKKVKKCKADHRAASIKKIKAIFAQFKVCVTQSSSSSG